MYPQDVCNANFSNSVSKNTISRHYQPLEERDSNVEFINNRNNKSPKSIASDQVPEARKR